MWLCEGVRRREGGIFDEHLVRHALTGTSLGGGFIRLILDAFEIDL